MRRSGTTETIDSKSAEWYMQKDSEHIEFIKICLLERRYVSTNKVGTSDC